MTECQIKAFHRCSKFGFLKEKKKCLFAFDKISCPKFKSQGEKNHFSKRGSQLSQGTGLLLKMNVVLKGLVI